MQLSAALSLIEKAFTKMDAAFGDTVFNEWAIVSLKGNRPALVHYQGDRKTAFLNDFSEDTRQLRQEWQDADVSAPGDFLFTREAEGHAVDAVICLADDLFLFCNHTLKTMEAITRDPGWLGAQSIFVSLTQKVAWDPVEG